MIKTAKGQTVTPRRRLVSCGVGSFCNDLISKFMFSFSLVFYVKVANLTSKQAGFIVVTGQATNFVASFLFGYFCDHVDVPFLSRVYRRRKSWHLIGTIFTVSFFVLSFTRCLLCSEPPSTHSWLGFGYFAVTYGMASFWWGAVDVAHLSIIPEISKTEDEIVIFNSIRAAFSYLGGICTYGVAWLFLGQSNETNLSPNNSMAFTKITSTMSAIGLLFVVIFHVGCPEMRQISEKSRRKSSSLHSSGVYSVSIVYGLEHGLEGNDPNGDNIGRKKSSVTSVLRKVSMYIVPFDSEMPQDDGNPSPRYGFSEDKIGTNGHVRETSHKTPPQATMDPHTIVINSIADDIQELQETQNNIKTPENIEKVGRSSARSVKELLKNPLLYKVTVIFTSVYSLEELTFSYLALYLMDHLHFNKEATAYFSIIFLVSGIFGCAVSKKLDKVIGRRWTFCGVAVLAIITATWFYFVNESIKQTVYAPIVLFGCCVSSMIVLGLSYIGDFVGENKESAGFVFALATAAKTATTGGMFMLIQLFYPSDSDGCQDCGNYVRVVYPLVLGFLPLIGLLVVLFSELLTLKCCDKKKGQPSESNVVTNLSAEDTGVPFPSGKTEITEWNTRL